MDGAVARKAVGGNRARARLAEPAAEAWKATAVAAVAVEAAGAAADGAQVKLAEAVEAAYAARAGGEEEMEAAAAVAAASEKCRPPTLSPDRQCSRAGRPPIAMLPQQLPPRGSSKTTQRTFEAETFALCAFEIYNQPREHDRNRSEASRAIQRADPL